MRCEIKSSCSSSIGCQYTKPMRVDPDSNITLNCSVAGGRALDMTWNQAKQRLEKSNGSSDLILHNSSSTNIGKYSCSCTGIHFTRKYFLVCSTLPVGIHLSRETVECAPWISLWLSSSLGLYSSILLTVANTQT